MSDRYLIVGLGSIGRRHLKCLREARPDADITVWRQQHHDADLPEGADRVVFDLAGALAAEPVCAIVANPAALHVQTALSLAEAGVHLLVEKPLSDSMQDVDRLLSLCESKGLILAVAYVLRFHEGLIVFRQAIMDGKIGRILSFRAEVGQYLPDWRLGSDYRSSVSARKELGGGALLELSHELDYIRWVFGEVKAASAVMIHSETLDVDVEDMVEGILQVCSFDGSPITGSVHMDMLQRIPHRGCRVIGEMGTLEWNPMAGVVRGFYADSKAWHNLYEASGVNRDFIYIRQLESFLDAVRDSRQPVVSGKDGRAVLQIIDAMRASAANGETVKVI